MQGRVLLLLLSLSVAAAAGPDAGPPWLQLEARVTAVKDANNITAVDAKGTVHLIRLAGCDAPERIQVYGREAYERLKTLVLDRDIRVWHRFADIRGRTLGHVYVGEKWVNRLLVAAGLAWYYDPDRDAKPLAQVERDARRERQGLWRRSKPIPPWHWRRGTRAWSADLEEQRPRPYPRSRSSNDRRLLGYP